MSPKQSTPVVIPVRLPETVKSEMDQAVYRLSAPGKIVKQSEYIREAIEEKNQRVLGKKKK